MAGFEIYSISFLSLDRVFSPMVPLNFIGGCLDTFFQLVLYVDDPFGMYLDITFAMSAFNKNIITLDLKDNLFTRTSKIIQSAHPSYHRHKQKKPTCTGQSLDLKSIDLNGTNSMLFFERTSFFALKKAAHL